MTRRSILILLFSSLGGCQTQFTSFRVDTEPYALLEHGEVRSVWFTTLEYRKFYPLFGEAGGTAAVLTNVTAQTLPDATAQFKEASPSHRYYTVKGLDFNSVASAMTDALDHEVAARPSGGPGRNERLEPIRWIASVDPPILVEGTRKEPPAGHGWVGGSFSIGETFRLISAKDLDEQVASVFILDRFPSDPGALIGEELNRWRQTVSLATRRIRFASPTSLKDVLQEKLRGQESTEVNQPP